MSVTSIDRNTENDRKNSNALGTQLTCKPTQTYGETPRWQGARGLLQTTAPFASTAVREMMRSMLSCSLPLRGLLQTTSGNEHESKDMGTNANANCD